MKVTIWGNTDLTQQLEYKVRGVLEELWLTDFIALDIHSDVSLKNELGITQDPALIIEEESIDFKDMIFEGLIPEEEELKSMFISIIWGSSWGSCGSKGDDGSCGSGCSC